MARRIFCFCGLLLLAWCIMVMSHELGHIIAGVICGATLEQASLVPWGLPYSIFNPDPFPLVTLWGGPVLGVAIPLVTAILFRKRWLWLIAYFCLLANGLYLGLGWISGEDQLDTTKLLNYGAHPISILVYCTATVVAGYLGFRQACIDFFTSRRSQEDLR